MHFGFPLGGIIFIFVGDIKDFVKIDSDNIVKACSMFSSILADVSRNGTPYSNANTSPLSFIIIKVTEVVYQFEVLQDPTGPPTFSGPVLTDQDRTLQKKREVLITV